MQSFSSLERAASQHASDILNFSIGHRKDKPTEAAIVLFDRESELSKLLTDCYIRLLPHARAIEFGSMSEELLLEELNTLDPSDLIVLIQSASFRMSSYRIRVELFKRGVKVIEHSNLSRMTGEAAQVYVDALAYDPEYYRTTGRLMQARLNATSRCVVKSKGGCHLYFDSPLEESKLNTGDFETIKNVGSTYPIGEVFTESRDLEAVHGEASIFAFANTRFVMQWVQDPIVLVIEKGRVVDTRNSIPDFDDVLANIRAHENEVWVRELGLGMNQAFSKTRVVRDVAAYERISGVHLSLGAKHGVFKKPSLRARDARYHVDVFLETEAVLLDGENIYDQGVWLGRRPKQMT